MKTQNPHIICTCKSWLLQKKLQLCYNAILNVESHCNSIVKQNINILLFFTICSNWYFNSSLSHWSLSSPLLFFFFLLLIFQFWFSHSIPPPFSSLFVWIGARALVYLKAYGVGQVVWWRGSSGMGKWCGSVGLVASADLFHFFFFFFSISSLESSLRGSHSLVELIGLMWWQMWQIRAVLRWCIDGWWLCCS